jgi:hypothetical protein
VAFTSPTYDFDHVRNLSDDYWKRMQYQSHLRESRAQFCQSPSIFLKSTPKTGALNRKPAPTALSRAELRQIVLDQLG